MAGIFGLLVLGGLFVLGASGVRELGRLAQMALAGVGWVCAGAPLAVATWTEFLEGGFLLSLLGLALALPASGGLLLETAWARAERRVLRTRLGMAEGEEVGDVVVGGEHLSLGVRYVTSRGPRRFLDGRGLVITCRVGPEELSLDPPRTFERGWPDTTSTRARRVWFQGAVADVFRTVPDVRLRAGTVELRRGRWATPERLDTWIGEIGSVVTALRASAAGAADRLVEATQADDPTTRRRAWEDLADVDVARFAALAPVGRRDPDPYVRVLAAEVSGPAGVPVIGEVLRRSDDPEALTRAARWVVGHPFPGVAALAAGRLGVPPDAAWEALLAVVAAHGGVAEMERLHEVREGSGFPAALRARAAEAIEAVRGRAGADGAGRVGLVESAAGGALALATPLGAVAVVDGSEGGRVAAGRDGW